MFNDLREFINKAEELDEVKLIEGANWESDIGVLTDIFAEMPNAPLLLFDKVDGYPAGYRVVSNLFTTPKRTALGLGLPLTAEKMELVRAMREKIEAGIDLLPPLEVKSGPVKENIDVGEQVDLFKFPTPKWHELDGGRYIGTGMLGIIRDPEEGWVNFGTYRVQIHDKSTVTVHIGPANQGYMIQKKYWAKGLNCPIAICCGQEPSLFAAAAWERVPWGVSEYDFAGGLRGEPVEVTKGVTTDLPIPATAEIVIEGEIVPPEVETRIEGPFGEWWAHFGGGRRPVQACRIKSVLYRNAPILQGNPPSRFPSVWTLGRHIQKSASLWAELDRHIPSVKGAWMIEDASMHAMPVISIKQEYGGHAKQAALIAAGCSATGRAARIIIVVDEDIDPSNLSEVVWALATRIDPETSIDIVRDCWDSPWDPMFSPEHKRLKQQTMSRALITACKPFWWIDEFAPSIKTSPELLAKVKGKWAHILMPDC
ncbi:UbiD family decarboxylase [Chloroflexota bacterium]